jgi:citrate synthase
VTSALTWVNPRRETVDTSAPGAVGIAGGDHDGGRRAMLTGLDGVVVAETVMSHAEGDKGILWVRGHTLGDLVANHGYEGAVALLWEGFAGSGLDRAGIRAALGAGRAAAFARLGEWLDIARSRPPLDGLKLCLAALKDNSPPTAILASLPVGIAALIRAHQGLPPLAPDPSLSTAADLLRMVHGAAAPEAHAAALDAYWTAVIDNGLSTATFTARIIASTRASLAAAVLGGYCAFTGPLHGGAPGPTLDMLDEIAASGDPAGWIERKLAAGERLMGFGHRAFRTRDPRADALAAALQRLGPEAGRLAFAAEVEKAAAAAFARLRPGRKLEPNVEIYAALLLDAVGLPRDAFTPIFAVGRAAGWIAHALEQSQTARYIRPSSAYIGPVPA